MCPSVEIAAFEPEDAPALAELCRSEGWDFWDDPDAVARALSAPGVTTLVARVDGTLVGGVEILSDGVVNWIVGMLIVAPAARGRGVGTRLLETAVRTTGARRLDLQTEADGPRFYRRFAGREMTAFRLYPIESPDAYP